MKMQKESKTGRPESYSAEYFSNSVHESDILKVMCRKYKYERFGAYYRLLEQAIKSDFHRIELKNDTQKHIFQMNMDVRQEVIDFLIDLLLQMEEMDKQQWEINQTIYLNKFVRQFKYLWYKRYKSIPDSNGNYTDRTKKKDTNRVSDVRKGNNRIEYNSNNKVEDNDIALTISEYEKLYPNKNLEFVNNYIKTNPNPKHSKAINLCEIEMKTKPLSFNKTPSGLNKAWCSKCGNKAFPDDYQIKQGSECCIVEYTNEEPTNKKE